MEGAASLSAASLSVERPGGARPVREGRVQVLELPVDSGRDPGHSGPVVAAPVPAGARSYVADNVSYWTHRAPSYGDVNRDELAGGQRARWAAELDGAIRADLPDRPRAAVRVLDVGTGPGFFSIVLAELGYDVDAVDYTPAMLGQARANARAAGMAEGAGAGRIAFARGDAAALPFPSGSFDVIVSRNLTWNLPDPAAAYAEWVRVLAPGGLMLNFDANWYRYLYDGALAAAHAGDRERVAAGVAAGEVVDDTAGTDVDAMEAIARRAPLSRRDRPAWDLRVLAALGLDAEADGDAWLRLWTADELANNASTPMFRIKALDKRGGRIL